MPGPYDFSQGTLVDDGTGRQFLAPMGMFAPPPVDTGPVGSATLPPPTVGEQIDALTPNTLEHEPAAPVPQAAPPKVEAPQPEVKAPAAPKPTATPQSAKPGDAFQQADQAMQSAIDEQQQAGEQAANTQAAAADAKYGAQRGAMEEYDRLNAERQRVAADRERQRVAMQERVDRYVHDEDNFKLDENKFWGDASTARNIGRVIAMAMTGLGMALQGRGHEQNPVIAMFDSAARQSIQMQMDQRDQLGKRTARAQTQLDAFDRISNDKDARFNADMARAYERGIRMGDLATSRYAGQLVKDNWKGQRAEFEKAKAEYAGKAAEGAFNRDVTKQQLQVSKSNAALGWANFGESKRQFDINKDMQQQKLDMEAMELAQKGDIGKAKLLRDSGIAGVKNADGSTFIAQGGEAEVAKLRDKVIAARQLVGLMDEAKRVRTGWTSDAAKSKEWQELQAIWAANKGVAKNLLGLGALSESDYDLMDKFLGAKDPTEFRDPTSGINQARKNIIRMTGEELRGRGYEGTFDIKDVSSERGGTQTSTDEAAKMLLKDPGKLPMIEGLGPAYSAGHGIELQGKAMRESGGMHPRQRQAMDMFAAGLASPDQKVREFAYASLSNAAQGGGSQGVRDYAQKLLLNAQTSDMLSAGTREVPR